MTPTNNTLLRTLQLTIAVLILSFLWLAPASLAHGNLSTPNPCFFRIVAVSACFGSAINLSQGTTFATPGTPFTIAWGDTLSLNVDSASAYTFSGSIGLLLESVSIGSGGGVTLLVLCNDPGTGLNVPSSVPGCSQFVSNNGKTMNIPLSGPEVTGTYNLTTINGVNRWESMHADGKSAVKFVPAGTNTGNKRILPPVRKAGPPVITSVNMFPDHTVPVGGSLRGVIGFTDSDADVDRFELRTLSNSTVGTQSFNPRMRGFNNGSITFDIFHSIYCQSAVPFSINVVLIDQAGNESNPVQVDFTCTNPTQGTAPVIIDISPKNPKIKSNGNLWFTINFSDQDGDIVRAEGRYQDGTMFSFWDPGLNGINSGSFFELQYCGGYVGKLNYNIVLIDQQGNESSPMPIEAECGNGPGFLSIQSVESPIPNENLGGHVPASLARVDSNATTLSIQAVQLNAVSTGSFELRVYGQGIASVQMQVFNLSGNEMFSETSSGNALRWQGLDTQGNTLSNGVYFYVVTTMGMKGEVHRSQVKKLVILH